MFPSSRGSGPYEVAVAAGLLDDYLDLCSDLGVSVVETGAGFTDPAVEPEDMTAAARSRGLRVRFELGRKDEGPYDAGRVTELRATGRRWLAAGAEAVVIEARESARGIGIFDTDGRLDVATARVLLDEFGEDKVYFEAPDKASQFSLLRALGPRVQLSNVRLEEILRVEIFRHGLHADAFAEPHLRPSGVTTASGRLQ